MRDVQRHLDRPIGSVHSRCDGHCLEGYATPACPVAAVVVLATITMTNADDPNFRPCATPASFTHTLGSDISVSVVWEGCYDAKLSFLGLVSTETMLNVPPGCRSQVPHS